MKLATVATTSVALFLSSPLASAQCPDWLPGFGLAGPEIHVRAQLVDSSGPSPRLVIGGLFESVPGLDARYVATWDGQDFGALGAGTPGPTDALALYDDGTGPAIYAAGRVQLPTPFLVRFDGTSWVDMGITGGAVRSMLVHDDGNGPALFVTGGQLTAPGVPASVVLRYDGAWSSVVPTLPGAFFGGFDLAVHDDGTGPALHVCGGPFDGLPGIPQGTTILRWDGANYARSNAGGPAQPFGSLTVVSIESSRIGGVPSLHAGRAYANSQFPGNTWAYTNGGQWFTLPSDFRVDVLHNVPDPSGTDVVYAGLDMIGGGPDDRQILRFDGTSVTALPNLDGFQTFSMSSFGGALHVGTNGVGTSGSALSRWNGTSWEAPIATQSPPGFLRSLSIHDFGAGREIAAIVENGPTLTPYRFDGNSWTPLPPPVGFNIIGDDLASFDGQLFATGTGTSNPRHTLARFDGTSWERLGPGVILGDVVTVEPLDVGNGPELYVGGSFRSLGPNGTFGLARWNGATFESVGGGVPSNAAGATVRAFRAWDAGQGTELYAAGAIGMIGGAVVEDIARFDGAQWHALPPGPAASVGFQGEPSLFHMEPAALPTGRLLVVSGRFDLLGSQTTAGIAGWDGQQWVPMSGGPFDPVRPIVGPVEFMGVADVDGRGDRVYARTDFITPVGTLQRAWGVWDGTSWDIAPWSRGVTGGYFGQVFAELMGVDIGRGRELLFAGRFLRVGDHPTPGLAFWRDPCAANVGTPRCAPPPGPSGAVALCRATGSASVTTNDLTLRLSSAPAGRLALFALGTAAVPTVGGPVPLCIGGDLRRAGAPAATDASGTLALPVDLGAPYAANAMAGIELHAQAFFQDGPGFAASDALAITFLP